VAERLDTGIRRLAAAGAAALTFLLFASVPASTPFIVVALTCALALLAALRPADGLLVVAAFVPISGALTDLLRVTVGWTEPLILAALGGWLVGAAFGTSAVLPPRGVRAAWIMLMIIVAASLLVQLAVLELFFAEYPRDVFLFLRRSYIQDRASFPQITGATRMFEGLLLFAWATHVARERGRRALTAMLTLGIVAVAAVNLNRFLQVVLRHGASEIRHFAMSLRINVPFSDVNAAGSMFVLGLPLAAVRMTAPPLSMALWTAALLFCAAALWLTGSRTAIAVGVLLAIAALGITAIRRTTRRPARIIAATGILAIAASGFLVRAAYPDRFAGIPAAESLRIRAEMAATALRMAERRPVFGVGIGQFFVRSPEFMSPAMTAHYPRENAHNNFLQILAELGGVGLVTFLWLVGVAMLRAHGSDVGDLRIVRGLQVGVGAFLLTCLAGHPLLVQEAASAFWIALGTLAAVSRAPVIALWSGRFGRATLAGAILLIALSVWPRARHDRSEAHLEHVAFGVSAWRRTPEGELVRDVGRHASFFVPADARIVQVPLRLSSTPAHPVVIRIGWEGRIADELAISDERWHTLRFIVPRVPGAKFRRVDVNVDAAHTATSLLMGKPTYR
jgi:O-antigen ligase